MTPPAAARPGSDLLGHWVEAAVYTGAVLALLAPLVYRTWGGGVLLIHLCGIAYLAHQVEEHWQDRFRHFVNERVLGGAEALTPAAIWWINLPGVWGVNLAALYAAILCGPGNGLVAAYLMIVNALGHSIGALRFGYNPGLWTSLALFFPLGALTLVSVRASTAQHLTGLGAAITVHLAIIIYVLARVRAAHR